MKRRNLCCLCLCALLLCASCLPAYAAPGDTVLYPQRAYYDEPEAGDEPPPEADYLSSVAILPEGVYALVNDRQVTRWQPGDEAPETLFELEDAPGYYAAYPETEDDAPAPEDLARIEASIHSLIAGDDGLYALNLATLALAKVSDTSYDFLDEKLDMPEMEMQETDWRYLRDIGNAFVYEGDLFLLLSSLKEDDWGVYTLYRVPLSGEPRQEYEVLGLTGATPYKDGKLLVTVPTTAVNGYGTDLAEFSIETGTVGKVVKQEMLGRGYGVNGFAYVPAEEAVYYLDQNQVQRLEPATGAVTGLCFLAASGYGGDTRTGVLEGGYFALSDYQGIYIRNIDPAYKVERALRIAGGWEDDAYRRFLKAHPEIPVLLLDSGYMDVDDIAQAIQTGETEVDIFNIYGFSDLSKLLDKGYAADLSGSESLTRDVSEMYPQVQAALKDGEGVLRAYPTDLYYYPMLVNMTLFEEYFPGEELPETWEEFLTLYLVFAQDPPEDVAFLDYYVERDALVYRLLQQFARQYEGEGEADFESPVLRAALELVAQLPVGEQMDSWSDLTGDELATLNDYYSRQNIFSTETQPFEDLTQRGESQRTVSVSPSVGVMISESYDDAAAREADGGPAYRLMPTPVFEKGQEPKVEGQMTCMVVNPKSSNLDFAIQYLEALPDAMSDQTRYALHPALDEPVRHRQYESWRKDTLAYLAEMREALPEMEAAERKEAEEQIAQMEEQLRWDEEHNWSISAGAIRDYREIAPYLSLTQGGIFDYGGDEGSKQIYDLVDKYIQGQLQLTQFLKELNAKARMIRREQL